MHRTLTTEQSVLVFLQRGGRHTAKEVYRNSGINPDTYETLITLEKDHMVYRAYTPDDWTTFHLWKITGCGAIQLQFRFTKARKNK